MFNTAVFFMSRAESNFMILFSLLLRVLLLEISFRGIDFLGSIWGEWKVPILFSAFMMLSMIYDKWSCGAFSLLAFLKDWIWLSRKDFILTLSFLLKVDANSEGWLEGEARKWFDPNDMNEAQFLNKKVFFKNCQFRESNKTCLFQYFLKINTSKN